MIGWPALPPTAKRPGPATCGWFDPDRPDRQEQGGLFACRTRLRSCSGLLRRDEGCGGGCPHLSVPVARTAQSFAADPQVYNCQKSQRSASKTLLHALEPGRHASLVIVRPPQQRKIAMSRVRHSSLCCADPPMCRLSPGWRSLLPPGLFVASGASAAWRNSPSGTAPRPLCSERFLYVERVVLLMPLYAKRGDKK